MSLNVQYELLEETFLLIEIIKSNENMNVRLGRALVLCAHYGFDSDCLLPSHALYFFLS